MCKDNTHITFTAAENAKPATTKAGSSATKNIGYRNAPPREQPSTETRLVKTQLFCLKRKFQHPVFVSDWEGIEDEERRDRSVVDAKQSKRAQHWCCDAED
jgi:hypothetical protein